MIMVLCLLVYNLAQRQLRLALALAQDTIPNQLGKPTNSPTLRWVFSPSSQRYYLLPDPLS